MWFDIHIHVPKLRVWELSQVNARREFSEKVKCMVQPATVTNGCGGKLGVSKRDHVEGNGEVMRVDEWHTKAQGDVMVERGCEEGSV